MGEDLACSVSLFPITESGGWSAPGQMLGGHEVRSGKARSRTEPVCQCRKHMNTCSNSRCSASEGEGPSNGLASEREFRPSGW